MSRRSRKVLSQGLVWFAAVLLPWASTPQQPRCRCADGLSKGAVSKTADSQPAARPCCRRNGPSCCCRAKALRPCCAARLAKATTGCKCGSSCVCGAARPTTPPVAPPSEPQVGKCLVGVDSHSAPLIDVLPSLAGPIVSRVSPAAPATAACAALRPCAICLPTRWTRAFAAGSRLAAPRGRKGDSVKAAMVARAKDADVDVVTLALNGHGSV